MVFISPAVFAAKATLNLKDTDIQVFIESVSRITGKTFIIDPRVKNKKVTVISQHEMDEDEIFALFLSVLKVHQFSAVETNGVYKIEQLQAAKQDSVPVYVEGGKRFTGDQLVTRVIKVDNVDVGQLVPLLRTLISTQGHMAQYKPTNVMVIHDTAANLERIVKIIRQIDKESNEEIEVVPLQHASATEIVRILESLEKQSGQSKAPTSNKPRFVADERTNSILLSADSKASLRLKVLIARLDSEISNNGNTNVIYLKYANAEELATLLEGVGESIEKEEGKDNRKSRRGNDKAYSIKAHAETNSLVITAAPDIMRSFESVIAQLDLRRKQVHVEAVIVEISDTKVKELGVQWVTQAGLINFSNSSPSIAQVGGGVIANQGLDAQGSTVTTTAPDGTTTTTTPGSTGGDNGAALAQVLAGTTGALFGFTDDKSWAGLVKALATDIDSNVLSTPFITTLDNEEAVISIGQEIPILTGSTLGGNNANPFQTVERKDVGIKLKITPQINEGDAVRLIIEQEVSSVAGATGTDIAVNKSTIKTAVLANNEQVIVLGGLIDDNIQESAQKVPVLGDLPIIGNLFSSRATTKSKRNLMVFIRPKIISDVAGFEKISSRKYNYMRAQQIDWQQRGISLMPSTESTLLPKWNEELALPPSFEETLKKHDLEMELEKVEENESQD
ncbi:type II secretion system protein GspD [Aliikangiella coralliicola]|uniref:Type II secretion system protein GspD n=2 Tax=Aliikangiella coralliicola TaxID=2592383 RepID=A0A545U809_9GAMM|nr:type II secretion system protein GspD [Aliikangiella coralliicola]